MSDANPRQSVETARNLQILRRALIRLSSVALPEAGRAALAEAQMALSALELVQNGGVDRSVFDALLAMAGPDVAPELTAQMVADLRAVRTALTAAVTARDWPVIRAQTHVLVALAGAAGARSVERMSQQLNLAAQDKDGVTVNLIGPRLLDGLQALIRFVEDAAPGHPQTG
ncbi:MAG: hypothetical protein MUC82_08555 [Cypionkella sp.]|jgi:hypothetical protein|nr:hypothetical protein [Cypionkella sp.]